LIILDGAFPECFLGIQYKLGVPFMYLNTVGFYTDSISRAGSPSPYSITPYFTNTFTDKMNFYERVINSVMAVGLQSMHMVKYNHHMKISD
jgi:hypothetical protein